MRILLVAVALIAVGLALGCGGDDPPALHRAARPVWCPAADFGRPASRFDARRLVGLELGAASQLAVRNRCTLRVVGGDTNPVVTMDLRPDRVNVDVVDGIVTGLDGRGGGPIG